MHKVLVAVDGSKISARVAHYAAHLKKTSSAYITIISVSLGNPETSDYGLVDPDFVSESDLASQNALSQTLEIFSQEGLAPDETVKGYGDPAVVITDLAKKDGYSLIIMGSRGLSGVKGVLLGSVSQKVLQIASCPVTIVK